jgi:hypothetical protein
MKKRYRWLEAAVPLLAVWLLGDSGAGSAAGSPGYLREVGPVPVRFQTPSAAVPALFWPPLVQPEKQTVSVEVPMTNAPATEAPAIEPLVFAVPSPELAGGLAATPPPPQPDMMMPFALPPPSQPDQVVDGLVDLQTRLNYLLSVSTNVSGARVIMPVFIPPAPPADNPSSRATYESR